MQPHIQYVEGDILFYKFTDEKIVNTLEPAPQVHVDVDARGNVVSIEIVGASVLPYKRVADVFHKFGVELEYRPQAIAS